MGADPAKIQAVQDWPTPTTTWEVLGFLGLAIYYLKFIQHFGKIVAPLTCILTKEGFVWTTEVAAAFQQQKMPSHAPVLKLPDFSSPFIIESDASRTGIGIVLMKNGHPIAYYSEAMKGSTLTLSTYEKEMLAVVKSVLKWLPYLLENSFTIQTDQWGLKYLLEQWITTPAQARWLPKILGYDYHWNTKEVLKTKLLILAHE